LPQRRDLSHLAAKSGDMPPPRATNAALRYCEKLPHRLALHPAMLFIATEKGTPAAEIDLPQCKRRPWGYSSHHPGGDEVTVMPYGINEHLPLSVRKHLPEHAQDIYREAFNRAYRAQAGEADREQRAHMIAWAAVKRSYVKAGDTWVRR
jgi:cation transport regulator